MDNIAVLGSNRNGNIGSVIANGAESIGIRAKEDDCWSNSSKQFKVPMIEWKNYDGIVISVGRTIIQPIDVMFGEHIKVVIDACLTLPLQIASQYAKARSTRGGGKIIFIGSYAHNHPLSESAAYCAAKAGLDMATRSLGWELTERGFGVHIVHPYHVPRGPMSDYVYQALERRGLDPETHQKKDLKMPEHLTPEEIARVVLWLLVEESTQWLSGTNIEMFGGTR